MERWRVAVGEVDKMDPFLFADYEPTSVVTEVQGPDGRKSSIDEAEGDPTP